MQSRRTRTRSALALDSNERHMLLGIGGTAGLGVLGMAMATAGHALIGIGLVAVVMAGAAGYAWFTSRF